ncbi:hypothetical protein GGR90_002751 [Sphingopyxis italica]|uniref:Uncharacterized protein n=1 Tax=Sphingopyxis italica TaxID=1129133 RepID=A0A7X6BA69_9SPHN|nr:hypothetical protein [Sphingopyxis italica]NJB90557.1 hypothetical protein [Sphingopyxis italica]
MSAPEPAIHVRKDGPIFRVQIIPPEAGPTAVVVPSTFVSHAMAKMSAKVLSDATGFPVTDLAGVGG